MEQELKNQERKKIDNGNQDGGELKNPDAKVKEKLNKENTGSGLSKSIEEANVNPDEEKFNKIEQKLRETIEIDRKKYNNKLNELKVKYSGNFTSSCGNSLWGACAEF